MQNQIGDEERKKEGERERDRERGGGEGEEGVREGTLCRWYMGMCQS